MERHVLRIVVNQIGYAPVNNATAEVETEVHDIEITEEQAKALSIGRLPYGCRSVVGVQQWRFPNEGSDHD